MSVHTKPSVLITGATGCVGHYLVDALAPDYHLCLLARDPGKFKFDPAGYPNVTVLTGDMDSIVRETALLAELEYCIHTATAWGGDEAERINVTRVHELFNGLNPERLRRIIYFSTASILGRDQRALPETERFGTEYIRTKYRCFTGLPQCRLYERIVTVFPTLIFGGDASHPFSNLSLALPYFRRYARILGRLKLELPFHFIHAEDIARLVRYLLEADREEKEYVLGNEAITLSEFTRRNAVFFGRPARWRITFTLSGLYRLACFLRVRMTPWDRFSAQYGNFQFRTVNCRTFNLPSRYYELEQILADRRLEDM